MERPLRLRSGQTSTGSGRTVLVQSFLNGTVSGPGHRVRRYSVQRETGWRKLCAKKLSMADLKIRVFKIGDARSEMTVTPPGGILKLVKPGACNR